MWHVLPQKFPVNEFLHADAVDLEKKSRSQGCTNLLRQYEPDCYARYDLPNA